MASATVPPHKPMSLTSQILHTERRLLERRRSVIACTTRLRRAARARAASPALLAGAAGLGFALERMTGRKQAKEPATEPGGHASSDFFRTVHKFSSLMRNLSRLLPS